jgi:hypothetical protein
VKYEFDSDHMTAFKGMEDLIYNLEPSFQMLVKDQGPRGQNSSRQAHREATPVVPIENPAQSVTCISSLMISC